MTDEFTVGDVIKSGTAYVVLTYVCKSKWNGMLLKTCDSGKAGQCFTCMEGFKGWKKTGRRFPQIAEVLKQM